MRDENPTDETATDDSTAAAGATPDPVDASPVTDGADGPTPAEPDAVPAEGAGAPVAGEDGALLRVDAQEDSDGEGPASSGADPTPAGESDAPEVDEGHEVARDEPGTTSSEEPSEEPSDEPDVDPTGETVAADHADATDVVGTSARPTSDPTGPDAADEPSSGSSAAEPDDVAPDEPMARPTPRAVVQSVGLLVAAALAGVLAVLPAPYAVNSPGPTRDVLGEAGGKPLISVDGAETYPSSGELRLTTISGLGGPGYPAYLVDVVRGWFSRSSVVRPVEDVYPQDVSQDEFDATNQGAMLSSQDNAVVAALVELGYEVPATLVVAGTVEGSAAEGLLEEGDVLTALDGTALPDYQTLVQMLADVTPGDVVTLTVRRHARDLDVEITTTERESGGAQIGVYIDPSFDMPIDVEINIDNIGGPSAGTMFALGLVDLLTPEDEVAGEVVAGTGTIDVTGAVGRIGGIRQKLAGARRDGADWFLAPADNCADVVGYEPDGLRVVSVATLHEAREAIVAIGAGEGDDLPTCTAAADEAGAG